MATQLNNFILQCTFPSGDKVSGYFSHQERFFGQNFPLVGGPIVAVMKGEGRGQCTVRTLISEFCIKIQNSGFCFFPRARNGIVE